MQNPNLVTTEAFKGFAEEVASELGITDKRMYEILDRDNPYPKIWRILNALGRLSPERIELVRADFNARCDRITRCRTDVATDAGLHKETSEAVQAVLCKAPRDVRRREIQEAIAELQKQLDILDAVDHAGLRTVERFAS